MNLLGLNTHKVNPIVTIAGTITRLDVAKDLAQLIGGESSISLANVNETTHYLRIENESNKTNRGST